MAFRLSDITFTWKPDKNPSAFISCDYTDKNSDEYNSSEFQKEHLLVLASNEGSVEPNDKCVLYLSCHNIDNASISDITVVSESRTLEINNNTDGYIATIRGTEISQPKDSPNACALLYFCKHHFNESYTNLNVKFLSLGERTSFCLHSIVVNISQNTEKNTLHTKGTLDINKLKKDVDAMGDSVSDRAKELLTTMEQFKQNKMKNFEDFIAFEQHSKKHPSSMSPAQDISSMMSSMFQTGALKSLLGDSQGSTDGRGPDMYKMLQAVCGSVSSMRSAASSQEDQHLNAIASPDSGLDGTKSHDSNEKQAVLMDALVTFVEQKIDQAKAELQSEFIELKRDVSLQITMATSVMNEKLDKIISLLQDVQGKKEESAQKCKTYQDYL